LGWVRAEKARTHPKKGFPLLSLTRVLFSEVKLLKIGKVFNNQNHLQLALHQLPLRGLGGLSPDSNGKPCEQKSYFFLAKKQRRQELVFLPKKKSFCGASLEWIAGLASWKC